MSRALRTHKRKSAPHHLAERFFAYTLFAVGLILGLGIGGFLSLSYLL